MFQNENDGPQVKRWVPWVGVGCAGLIGLVLTLRAGSSPWGELGGALVSGVVLSAVFLVVERQLAAGDSEREKHRIKRERELEERTAERETRERYQLALTMERDLTDRDLSGLKLSGVKLTYRELDHSILDAADLSGVDLSAASLRFVTLYGANLTGAWLSGAPLTLLGSKPRRPEGADLTGAELGNVDLTGAFLASVYWDADNPPLWYGAKWDPDRPPLWPNDFDPPENCWDPETNP